MWRRLNLSYNSDFKTADTHKEQSLSSKLEVKIHVNVKNETFLLCFETICFSFI